MIYIVNNYVNNKNDSLSYQPELKLNGEFYTEGILEPTTLFYINYGLNLATKRVNVENNLDDVYNNIYIKVTKELLYDAKNKHRQNFVF